MPITHLQNGFLDELQKIASERKKPTYEKAIDAGAPMLAGAGVGKTLSDLSFSKAYGASPRRKTIGALSGAAAGLGYYASQRKKKERKKAHRAAQTKTAAPFAFPGVSTKRFLSKPGKSISDISPKIGKIGTLPKM